MGAVYFYHLTRHPLEVTLSTLLEKSLEVGWRVVVRGPDPERLAWLDEKLWLGRDDGFLPHGLAGGPHDHAQPILLSPATEPIPGFTSLMSIDGAPVQPDEVTTLERTSILFDGHDDTAVQAARQQWKALTQAGCSAQYWSEASGKWSKEAET